MTPTTLSERPTYAVNFADAEINRNPFEVCHEIRKVAPAVYNPVNDTWMVPSYDHVKAVLADEDHFSADQEFFINLFGADVMEGMVNPRHDEARGIWSPHLTRPAVADYESLVSRAIDELMDPAIERLREGEIVDFFPDVNRPLPSMVIARLLGMPEEDLPKIADWSARMALFTEAWTASEGGDQLLADAEGGLAAMNQYVADQIESMRRGDDRHRFVPLAPPTPTSLTDDELRSGVSQLIWAGHETTSKLIGHMLAILADHPDQRQEIIDDRTLIPQAIEEAIRWSTPAPVLVKRSRGQGNEIGGVPIPDGAQVANLTLAANHDPSRWENPDEFDIHRPKKTHIGFGFALHVCLGMNLARLETRLFLTKLLDAVPNYRVAGEVDYGTNFMLRGPISIPIAL